ncbi:MAG TPA: sigma-70 family RNA polymerase sigma factor [Actinomycetota bacterium]|nr:sigma-70 family RNA polymerase sigma factor [Actinomycetota bacterium]
MERTSTLREEPGLRAAYAAHGGELYGFALRSLGDAGLAEEAVQETFLRAWRHSDRFDPDVASLRTWLFAICRHVIVDLARRRAVRPPLADVGTAFDGPPDGVDEVDRALVAWQVEEALRRIGDDHRRVLVEVYYRARPYAEVAGELGVPIGTIKSRVYYGLRALRLALEEMGVEG